VHEGRNPIRPGKSCELSRSGARLASGRAERRGRRRIFQFVRRAETGAPLSAFFSSRAFNSSRISRGFFPAARNLATSGGSLTTDGGRSPHAEAANTVITSETDANRRLGMMPLKSEPPSAPMRLPAPPTRYPTHPHAARPGGRAGRRPGCGDTGGIVPVVYAWQRSRRVPPDLAILGCYHWSKTSYRHLRVPW
jgi:hypothetical protein